MDPLLRLALLWSLSIGAFAGWLVAGLVPPGVRGAFLHEQDFTLTRPAGQALEITPSKWFFLPYLIGDCNVQFDVELGEGAELDVLLRQVEPRRVDEQLLPFHGRFTSLRLSTLREGAGFRTRDQALLGERDGGVLVSPGIASTVWIEARGRLLTANVAGKKLPVAKADDEYGMLTLLVRGGNAVLHRLAIENRGLGAPWVWSRAFWAVFGGLLSGLLVWALPSRRRLGFCFMHVLTPMWVWVLMRDVDLQLGLPEPFVMLCFLGVAHGLTLATRIDRRWLLVPAVGALVALAWVGHRALERADGAVDAVFGPRAGAQLSEAMAQLIRGPGGLHDVARPGTRVMLLGGQLLYDRRAPEEHLERLLHNELRSRLERPMDTPCLPTVDGHAAQQWQLFQQFFTGYRPQGIVFGVGAGEDAADPATGKPRSSPQQLRTVLEDVRAYCAQHGCKLVLWCERGLADPLLEELRLAERGGVPLVVAYAEQAPEAIAMAIAEAMHKRFQ